MFKVIKDTRAALINLVLVSFLLTIQPIYLLLFNLLIKFFLQTLEMNPLVAALQLVPLYGRFAANFSPS